MTEVRLFIGVALDDEAREQCAAVAARLERSGVRAHFVDPTNYHLTLIFLGNAESENVAEIEAALGAGALRHAPFTLTLARIGAFPHERSPRVIFIGAHGVDTRYRDLASDIRSQSARLGFASDDDTIPHVTLARIPKETRAALPLLDVAPFTLRIDALTLFESVPHDGRTRYLVRAAAALRP
jgi:RNA 2',3'-cyclic 3'-phosphodiesterase